MHVHVLSSTSVAFTRTQEQTLASRICAMQPTTQVPRSFEFVVRKRSNTGIEATHKGNPENLWKPGWPVCYWKDDPRVPKKIPSSKSPRPVGSKRHLFPKPIPSLKGWHFWSPILEDATHVGVGIVGAASCRDQVERWRLCMHHLDPLVNDFHVKLPRMMYKDHSVPFMAPWPNFLFWLGVGIGFRTCIAPFLGSGCY